jgi:hypothetical protein
MAKAKQECLSVLISVYERESPSFVAWSLLSLAEQTLPAKEVVLVKDGALSQSLEQVIE